MASEMFANSIAEQDETFGLLNAVQYTGDEFIEENVTDLSKIKNCEEKQKHDDSKKDVELLGSVTTSENPGLRTSARVIQKMKQDSIRPISPPPSSAPEKKETAKEEKSLPKTTNQPKASGGRVVWTNLERSFFFDAVNEFGKDFDAISNSINAKIKRKNPIDPSFKTRDHIRQLYYQSFHKISKYVKFSDEIKKPAQELYGIINYGEMRRKLAFVSEKNCMKLKELIYKGYVSIRNKGKTIRIKTPSCKALRRLNQLEEWQGDIKLPNKIEVRLKPATMESYGRVQNMAQNPIVRTIVPLQKKLISLIKTFQHKWRDQNTRWSEISSKIETDESTPTSRYQDQLICLAPDPTVPIYKPMINISELLSNINICLNSYEEKVGVKVRGETLCHDRIVPNKRQRSDSGCEKKSPETKKIKNETEIKQLVCELNNKDVKSTISNEITKSVCDDAISDIDLDETGGLKIKNGLENDLGSDHSAEEGQASISTNKDPAHGVENGCEVNTVKTITTESNSNDEERSLALNKEKKKKKYKKPCNTKNNSHILKPLLDEEMIKKVRQGWSMLNAGDLTVGDLYLMFGKDSKVILEYSWIEGETKIEENTDVELNEYGVPYNHTKNNENKYEECLRNLQSNSLANKLRHLLIIANLSEKAQRKCNCGHICDNVFRPKKFENDLKSYVSSKTYTSSQSDCGLFRQPVAAPFRRNILSSDALRTISNGAHLKQNRFLNSRISPSKQVVVKRLLLQPGVKQSYDIVTTDLHFKAFQRSLIEAGTLKLDPKSRFPNDNDADQNQNVEEKSIVDAETNKTENNVQNEKVKHPNNKLLSTIQKNDCNKSTAKKSDISVLNSPDSGIENCGSNDCYSKLGPSTSQMKENDSPDVSDSQSEYSDLFSNEFSNSDFIDEDPGIKQLMEIHLPSPLHINALDEGDSYPDIPPMSPMRLIREGSNEGKWLEENLNDCSLSSLLGHLEEISPDMSEAGGSMSLISEASMDDYVSKFAEYAASMQNQDRES